MKVIFVSLFCRIFYQIKYIFNTFSLFYEDYRFLFNQANWDHQDEVLAPPVLRGSYRIPKDKHQYKLKITDDNMQVDYPRQFLKGAHAPSVKAQHVIHWAPPSGFRRYG